MSRFIQIVMATEGGSLWLVALDGDGNVWMYTDIKGEDGKVHRKWKQLSMELQPYAE